MREIKKAKSEYEKLEPSDVFSVMPPVESLKALVSHVMTERVDKRGHSLDFFHILHFHYDLCVLYVMHIIYFQFKNILFILKFV